MKFEINLRTCDSQDITAWLGLSNMTGEVDDAVESAWNALASAINAFDGKYGYEFPYDPEIDHLANSNAALLTILESAGKDIRDVIAGHAASFPFGIPGADDYRELR